MSLPNTETNRHQSQQAPKPTSTEANRPRSHTGTEALKLAATPTSTSYGTAYTPPRRGTSSWPQHLQRSCPQTACC